MKRPSESPRAFKLTWIAATTTGRFSERLSGLFAARLWFTPWAVDTGERAERRHARWLEGAEVITVPFGRSSLAGFSAGAGPTILLVHGWGERAATMGALVKPLVDAGHRVVGVDLPAHGGSPGRRTNLIEEADAVRVIAAAVGPIDTVIAHSMGGAVATLALSGGMSAQRVVFVASALRLENAVEVFASSLRLSARAAKGLRRYIERRFGNSIWEELAVDRLAGEMKIPALVIHDADDTQIGLEDGRALAEAWPGARFVPTQGLGHVKILGDPEVVGTIREWLARGEVRVAG